jgi:hypothetical protein
MPPFSDGDPGDLGDSAIISKPVTFEGLRGVMRDLDRYRVEIAEPTTEGEGN